MPVVLASGVMRDPIIVVIGIALCTTAGCGDSSDESALFGSGGSAGQSGGGSPSTGGTSAGGSATGGTSTGGTSTGGSSTGGTSTGGSSAGGTSTGGASTGGASTGGTGAGGSGGCAAKAWCFDADGDGYGSGETKSGCVSPGAGWIESGSKPSACGDCKDQDQKVNPGVTACSSQAYSANGGLSYDYDCDGKETECGSNPKAETCKLNLGSCSGSGYLPVNGKYCGSMQFQKCEIAIPPTACKATVVNAAAIHCR